MLFFLVTLGTVCIWKDAHSEASVIMRTSNKGWSLGLKENSSNLNTCSPIGGTVWEEPKERGLAGEGLERSLRFQNIHAIPSVLSLPPTYATRCELLAALLSTILDPNL